MIVQVLGGIGLFLIGMVLTTDGLKAAAGEALRKVLLRFTGGPFKALLTGAGVTALIQSSSATTVATIGFVGAGLLTFEQALGVILGANVGTTATGWIVALFGLKFSMSTLALPLVGVGALMKLFFRGRVSSVGLALAGFGIIFVGIDVLQEGMEGLSTYVTPSELPGDSFGGRLLLVGIGFVMTSVMQSSSAAVATTLTALSAGSISLDQAAAMVIGVNVGTTVTASIAAVGASTSAKRAALAHVLFNIVTGVVAFALLPVLVWLAGAVGKRLGPGDATIMIAAFHTVFNLLGVALVLPFARPFCRVVSLIVKERGPVLTRHLDPNAAAMGAIAVEAVRQTAIEVARETFIAIDETIKKRRVTDDVRGRLEAAASAIDETTRYMTLLRGMEQTSEVERERHASTVHALDYLNRLVDTLVGHGNQAFADDASTAGALKDFCEALRALLAWIDDPTRPAPLETIRALSEEFAASRKAERERALEQTALGEILPDTANARIEAWRRLDEVAYYLWRITDRLRGERLQLPDQALEHAAAALQG